MHRIRYLTRLPLLPLHFLSLGCRLFQPIAPPRTSRQAPSMSTRPSRNASAPGPSAYTFSCRTCGRVICEPTLPVLYDYGLKTHTKILHWLIAFHKLSFLILFTFRWSFKSFYVIFFSHTFLRKVYILMYNMSISPALTPSKLHASPTRHSRRLKNPARTAADERSLVLVLLPKLISIWLLYDYWAMAGRGES